MDDSALELTGELAEELERNSVVDPRTLPARFLHLKAMAQSPKHAWQAFQDNDRDSLAMRLGRGAHGMLFGNEVAVWDQPAANGKGGKAPRNGGAWANFQLQNPGKIILNRKEFDHAVRLTTAIREHSEARRLLFSDDVIHEQTIEWVQMGRPRQSTPDARGRFHLVELKTTRCAEPSRFHRDAVFRGYHAQLADQAAAIESLTDWAPERVYIVAVETAEPFVVSVMQLSQRALDQGRRMCERWLRRLLECERDNVWPGYSETVTEFDVPEIEPDLVFGD